MSEKTNKEKRCHLWHLTKDVQERQADLTIARAEALKAQQEEQAAERRLFEALREFGYWAAEYLPDNN